MQIGRLVSELPYSYTVAMRVCKDLGVKPHEDAYRGQILDGWLGVSWVDYIDRLARSEILRASLPRQA